MAKESFLLYHGYYEPIKDLSFEDKGMLFDAIFKFSMSGQEPISTSRIYLPFQFFKNQMIQDSKKYDRIVERNSKNGQKGGRPEKPKEPNGFFGNPNNPEKPKKADTDTVTVTVTDTDTVTDTVTDLETWGNLIVAGNDPTWESMRVRKVSRYEMDQFISVAVRCGWKIETAQDFRVSLRGFEPKREYSAKKENKGKLQ